MSNRIGTCEGCAARYKIPETFQASKAKCKKCGGVVNIVDAKAAAPAAPAKANEETAAKRPASRRTAGAAKKEPAGRGRAAAGKGRAAAGARGRRGAAAKGRRGRGAEEAEEEGAGGRRGRRGAATSGGKNNNMMIMAVVAGVLVIGGGVGLFMIMGGNGDEETSTANASAQGGAGAGDKASAGDKATTDDAVKGSGTDAANPDSTTDTSSDGTGETTTQDSTDSADGGGSTESTDPPPSDIEEPEVADALITFDAFGKNEGTTDEEWTEIQSLIEEMGYGGRGRSRAMKKLQPFGLKALPALINTLSGVDLTDSTKWRDSFEVALFIQDELTYGTVKVPFKGDFSDEAKDINYNHKSVLSLVKYWQDRQKDPIRMEGTVEIFETNKAKAE